MEVKRVNRKLPEFQEIKKLIYIAFPKNEQFPFWLLRLMAIRKCIDFHAYYDNGVFAGISYVIHNENMSFILYLATNPEIRSKGYGSKILSSIKAKGEKKQVTLNIEPIDENASNYEQRKSRLSFYERNGFRLTNYCIKDNKDNYLIMSDGLFSKDDYCRLLSKFSFGLVTPKVEKITI